MVPEAALPNGWSSGLTLSAEANSAGVPGVSCVLRVTGPLLDIDALSEALAIDPYRTFRKGEARGLRKIHETSGICFEVSDAEFEEFDLQIQDAVQFLTENAKVLAVISGFPGVEHALLDFGIEKREVAVQCDYLPADVLRLAGNLGLGIVLSHYPICEETEESNPLNQSHPQTAP